MQENDTPDRFEDFLKKALEHYEENPPEAAWQHVASRIPVVEPAQPKPLSWYHRKYLVAASAALLMFGSVFAWQYAQINNALEQVKQANIAQNAEIDALKAQVDALVVQQSEAQMQAVSVEAQAPEANTTVQKSGTTLAINSAQNTTLTTQTTKAYSAPITPTGSYRQDAISSKLETKPAQMVSQVAPNEEQKLANTTLDKAVELNGAEMLAQSAQSSAQVEGNAVGAKPLSTLGLLASRWPDFKLAPQVPSRQLHIMPTIAIAKRKRYTLTIKALSGAHQTKEMVDLRQDRRGNHPTKYASQEYEKRGTLVTAGLVVEKSINKRISLFAGLGATHKVNEGMHSIKTKPDSHHGGGQGGGGGGHHDPDSLAFFYTIQTGAGIADIEVRAIDTSATQHTDDVEIKLHMREESRYLTLPLGIGVKLLQKGRLSLVAQGGLALHIPTKRNVEIGDLEFDAPFSVIAEPRHRQGARMRTDGPPPIHATWQTGLELGMALNPRWSMLIAPQLNVRANRALEQGWAEHKFTGAGVQVGLAYRI